MKHSLLIIAAVLFAGVVLYQVFRKYNSAHGRVAAQAGSLVNSDLRSTSGEDQYS